MHMSQSKISDYINGRYEPTLPFLRELDRLGANLNWLAAGTGPMHQPSSPSAVREAAVEYLGSAESAEDALRLIADLINSRTTKTE